MNDKELIEKFDNKYPLPVRAGFIVKEVIPIIRNEIEAERLILITRRKHERIKSVE